jgi:hypothetical protein
MRWLFQVPIIFDRLWLQRVLGCRLLLLIHAGRYSRRRYETVLEVIAHREPGPEFAVLSGIGRKSSWLQKHPLFPVRHRRNRRSPVEVAFRFLPMDEPPPSCWHMNAHRLLAPIVRLVLSRLLG